MAARGFLPDCLTRTAPSAQRTGPRVPCHCAHSHSSDQVRTTLRSVVSSADARMGFTIASNLTPSYWLSSCNWLANLLTFRGMSTRHAQCRAFDSEGGTADGIMHAQLPHKEHGLGWQWQV